MTVAIRQGERKSGDVYVGRPGRGEVGTFGNPYHPNEICSRCWTYHRGPAATIPCFKLYFTERVTTDATFRQQVLRLRGRTLWCPGCKGKSPCHAEVIVEWLEQNAS